VKPSTDDLPKAKEDTSQLESFSETEHPRITGRDGKNGFLHALLLSFAHHLPLSLKPDHIWLLITNAFASHVNLNSSRLRSLFTSSSQKLPLRVRDDSLVKGSSHNDWGSVLSCFSDQIADRIGSELRDALVANFSTTTLAEKAASEIVLMDTVQSYFKYEVYTRCGIPEITLRGTKEDWAGMRKRLDFMRKFDLDWWLDDLDFVLSHFERAFDGDIDRDFWRSFFKKNEQSGGPYISGWVNTLFPYILNTSSWSVTPL